MTIEKEPAEQNAIPATHVATLRCQTWHVWPETAIIEALAFHLDIGSGVRVPAKIAIVAYLNRTDPAIYTSEKTDIGPLIWKGSIPGLYRVRDTILKAPEDKVQVALEMEHAQRGEIDLSIAFAVEGDIANSASEAIRCTLFAFMALLNLRLGDLLTPVAPMQIRRVAEPNHQFSTGFQVYVINRKQLQTSDLDELVGGLVAAISKSPRAEKIRTSLELYGSHFFERQIRTRFLLLVMALEAIAVPTRKHDVAIGLIDQWETQVTSEMKRYADSSIEYASLEALRRELIHRGEDSIRHQIRMLFRSAAEAKGEDPAPLEQRALHVYDIRSSLVHDGTVAPEMLDKAEAEARLLFEWLFNNHLDAASKSQPGINQ